MSLAGSHDTSCISGRRNTVIGSCEMVYPSGLAAAAMVAGPTVPPPPALLSTAIGWPMNFEALYAIARIAMSGDPPPGQGTIKVIGLLGYSCAPAPAATTAPIAATAIIKQLR